MNQTFFSHFHTRIQWMCSWFLSLSYYVFNGDGKDVRERYLHPGTSVSSFRGGTVSNVLAYFLAACLCACRASISFLVLGIRHLKIQHSVITGKTRVRRVVINTGCDFCFYRCFMNSHIKPADLLTELTSFFFLHTQKSCQTNDVTVDRHITKWNCNTRVMVAFGHCDVHHRLSRVGDPRWHSE